MPLPPLEHNRDHLRPQCEGMVGPLTVMTRMLAGLRQASHGCGRTRPRPRRVIGSASYGWFVHRGLRHRDLKSAEALVKELA